MTDQKAQPLQNPIHSYSVDEVIAGEGDTGIGWFVLLEGKVGVFKHNRKIAEVDQCGMVFGELSGILNRPRTASLIALEATKVLSFASGLDQLIADHPDVTKKILVNLAERLARTTDDLLTAVEKDA
jgi:CRP-like cAMP-binding protein